MANILIVDDEPQVAKALGRMLRRSGFAVELAASGAEGLEKLAAFQADVVISDYRMPRMNGAELLAAVKESQPRAIGIILSGFADLRETATNDGSISQFVTKPWDVEQFPLLVQGLLAERDANQVQA